MNAQKYFEQHAEELIASYAGKNVVLFFRGFVPANVRWLAHREDAVLPAGTLSGAPKIRAMQIINELENNKRGIYGGAVGYIDLTGNLDTCIAIRLAYKKHSKVYVRSGAGIVADSVAVKEHNECINKAKAVMTALNASGEEE